MPVTKYLDIQKNRGPHSVERVNLFPAARHGHGSIYTAGGEFGRNQPSGPIVHPLRAASQQHYPATRNAAVRANGPMTSRD